MTETRKGAALTPNWWTRILAVLRVSGWSTFGLAAFFLCWWLVEASAASASAQEGDTCPPPDPTLSRTVQVSGRELVGPWGDLFEALAADSGRLYVGIGARLAIFDISQAGCPTLLGMSQPLDGPVRGIAVANGYAYVLPGGEINRPLTDAQPPVPVRLMDARDPADIREVPMASIVLAPPAYTSSDSFAPSRVAHRIAVLGDRLYVAGDPLTVYDIGDPANPRQIGSYAASACVGAARPGYLLSAPPPRSSVIDLLDVSDLASPTPVHKFSTFSNPLCGSAAFGAQAYLLQGFRAPEMVIVSLSAPFEVVGGLRGSFRGIAAEGKFVYLLVSRIDGIDIVVVDVSDPGELAQVARLQGFYRATVALPREPSIIGSDERYGPVQAVASETLLDDFVDPGRGLLPAGSADAPSAYESGYADGEYFIRRVDPPPTEPGMLFVQSGPPTRDGSISVDARLLGQTPGRMYLYCRANWMNGFEQDYRLAVAPSVGRFSAVSLYVDGQPLPADMIPWHPVTLVPARTSGAINRGDAWNRLELRCNADLVSVWINGLPVATTTIRTGTSLSTAFFTFGIGADLPPGDLAEARFDNLNLVVSRR